VPGHSPASTAQHDILWQAADLVGQGLLHTTLTERIDGLNAANLRRTHEIVERGSAIGKTVLAAF
jgi:NADPH2:quinone reductase